LAVISLMGDLLLMVQLLHLFSCRLLGRAAYSLPSNEVECFHPYYTHSLLE